MTFSLTGYDSIPTDGSGRVVITDINHNGSSDMDALICRSEIVISQGGNWYLNSNQESTEAGDRIDPLRVSKTIITALTSHRVVQYEHFYEYGTSMMDIPQ